MKQLYLVIWDNRLLGIYKDKDVAQKMAEICREDNSFEKGSVKIYSGNFGEVESG